MRCLESVQHQELQEFELFWLTQPGRGVALRVEEFNTCSYPAQYVAEHIWVYTMRGMLGRERPAATCWVHDDDAVFDPHWLAAYVRSFTRTPTCAAAVRSCGLGGTAARHGCLSLMQADPTCSRVSLLDLSDEFRLTRDGFFFGVNMRIRRQVLSRPRVQSGDFGDRWLGTEKRGASKPGRRVR